MSKNSTLIYFVNDFHMDLMSADLKQLGLNSESKLATMEQKEIAPSEQTINNILNFARSYEVIETQKAGYVEMNLN